jgi:Transcriptional regulator, AbiEi antitoxin
MSEADITMRAMTITATTPTHEGRVSSRTKASGGNTTHMHDRWVIFPPMRQGEDRDARSLLGDTFTYGEARRAGLGDSRIYRLRDRGDIIPLGGGVYRWADAPSADHDLIEISERVPMATICLETALARHHLIDSIPAAIDIAVPRSSPRPKLSAPIRLHQFNQRTFELGRQTIEVGGRREIGIYSPERSLVDAIRLRHREGSDIAFEALRNWLDLPGRSPAQLIGMARQFPNAEAALRQALEVLL